MTKKKKRWKVLRPFNNNNWNVWQLTIWIIVNACTRTYGEMSTSMVPQNLKASGGRKKKRAQNEIERNKKFRIKIGRTLWQYIECVTGSELYDTTLFLVVVNGHWVRMFRTGIYYRPMMSCWPSPQPPLSSHGPQFASCTTQSVGSMVWNGSNKTSKWEAINNWRRQRQNSFAKKTRRSHLPPPT